MMGVVGAVVDAAIGWLVQSILGSLFTAQMEAWAREVGLAEEVENLKSEMRNVEMVLAAADGRRIDYKPLARSLDDLKDLLYDAEDVMDELDYYRLQQQIQQGDACTTQPPEGSTPSYFQLARSTASRFVHWARKRKRMEVPLESKLDISERIKGIVNRLVILRKSVQQVLQLDISHHSAMANQSQYVARLNTRLTTSIPIEHRVYGRNADRDKIIELLINGKSSDLHVLPVVGIGGIGKTTLARFVYNDQRIRDHFALRMWVCVSTNFNKVRLTREILEHVCTDRQQYENISNFNKLQENLLKNVENKRFLLVLDDMWEEKDRDGWFSLLAPLRHNHVPGCMILATTRRPSVAKMISTKDPVQLNGLDEKEFWLYFKACAFGNENHEGKPRLQSIGQQIVKTLKGCPLAARSVGALLNRNVSYEHWRAVQNKWKFLQEDTDDILPILKLSYDFLPVHLQHCFSYCSLFPEDHRFYKENLVRAWISQNFVQCEYPTKRLEETGKQYLDNLTDLGFFQKFDSHYVMHDFMHELAQTVSLNQCATISGSESEAILPNIRHLSIVTTSYDKFEHYNNFHSERFENILANIVSSNKLRTLMVFGSSSIHLLRSLHTLCKKSKSLRTVRIYVTHDDVSSTLNSLNTYHIRYLEFVGVLKNIALPQALGNFYHLQLLGVGIESNISVPTRMNNLVNLRNFDAHEKVQSKIAGVGKLTSLQQLAFKVGNVGDFEIKQLRYLNKAVVLKISQLEHVKTKEEAGGARLIDKEYLEVLSLSWNDISSMGLKPCRDWDVIEGLQPHQNLKNLRITGYSGGTSPTWLASDVSVKMLQILHLENCREWQTIPSLEMFPFLRKLKLIRMCKLKEICIPCLEELVLIEMPILEKCLGTYRMELSSHLRVMLIKNCPQLNEFTLFQSHSCFQAEQHSWFPFLSKLSIWCCPRIIKWEILPLGEMRELKELMLMDLHLVRELSIPSLEKLVLIKMSSLGRCSGLTAPPFSPSEKDQEMCLSSLHSLTIHDCPSLMVSHPLPPSDHIRELSTKGNSSINMSSTSFTIRSNVLTVLDDQILAFNNLPRGITRLEIRDCPNLIFISSEGFSQLTSLERLSILNCPILLKPPITVEAASAKSTSRNILVLPSLKYLRISSCGIAGGWLNKILPHMQSLKELRLHDCPQMKWLSINQPTETKGSNSLASAAALSEEDQMQLKVPPNILCSLKVLTISKCVDLEFYGGKVGLVGFTTLKVLRINGCPKLVSLLVSNVTDDTSNLAVGLLPPSLEVLSLSHLPQNLQSYFPKGLAYLKDLTLRYGPCLKCVQLQSCTALKYLQIWKCEQLGALEGLQFLSSLRSLAIEMNPELSAAWGRDPRLQEQEQGGNQIELLPVWIDRLSISNLTNNVSCRLLSCLPAITKLSVCQSPELTSLQLGYCTALTELEIIDCDSLASIEGFRSITNLTTLGVAYSSSLLPWMELLLQQQGACEVLSRLKYLRITGDASVLTMSLCKQLTSLRYLRFWGEEKSSMVQLAEEQERALQLLSSLLRPSPAASLSSTKSSKREGNRYCTRSSGFCIPCCTMCGPLARRAFSGRTEPFPISTAPPPTPPPPRAPLSPPPTVPPPPTHSTTAPPPTPPPPTRPRPPQRQRQPELDDADPAEATATLVLGAELTSGRPRPSPSPFSSTADQETALDPTPPPPRPTPAASFFLVGRGGRAATVAGRGCGRGTSGCGATATAYSSSSSAARAPSSSSVPPDPPRGGRARRRCGRARSSPWRRGTRARRSPSCIARSGAHLPPRAPPCPSSSNPLLLWEALDSERCGLQVGAEGARFGAGGTERGRRAAGTRDECGEASAAAREATAMA